MNSIPSNSTAFPTVFFTAHSASIPSSTSSPASPDSAGNAIYPLAGSLRRVSNEHPPSPIQLEDVPEKYREHFAFLRTSGSIPPAHPPEGVMAPESERFSSRFKGSGDTEASMEISQSPHAAANCMPMHRDAIYKSVLGGDYQAYLACRLNTFTPAKNVSSMRIGPPWWARTHLEVKKDVCSLESPKGCIRAEFMMLGKEMRLTYSGRESIIQFGDKRRVARCGIGIPYRWVDKCSGENASQMTPLYMSPRFQPVALSPDEKTVFCILEKENCPPLLLKIQETCTEEIAMPPEMQCALPYICSMGCNAANTLFIHSRRDGLQLLYIFENGNWSRMDLYSAYRHGDFILDNGAFFISNVSSKGHLVFTPHDVNANPRLLICARDARDRQSHGNEDAGAAIQWWKLPRVGAHGDRREPCIFSFSADGEYLAFDSRNFMSPISQKIGAVIIRLSGLSPKRLSIGKTVSISDAIDGFGYRLPLQHPGWTPESNPGGQNDCLLSFSDDNLTLTRTIHNPDDNIITSYAASVPPDMALKPLFAPFEKIIDAKIVALEKESKSETAQ